MENFNKLLKTTGGRYHLQTHDLDFNPKVLEKAGETAFIGVIKHELCHYHLHLSGPGYQHKDKAFKQLLQKVGGLRYTPSLIEKSEQKRLLKYQCLRCGAVAKRQRRFNTERFVCAKCKGKFQLIEKIDSQ